MASTTESSTDGPVVSVISKRIRALRKKYNRIVQMEESLSSGKVLNKEQEEVLRSKPIIVALIDELEKLRSPLVSAVAEELQQASGQKENQNLSESENEKQEEPDLVGKDDERLEDLLKLMYFGSLFDVKAQGEFTSMMLTRSHERGCCLTYDYVTDDEVDLLKEKDLDMLALLNSLMTSRAVTEGVSHKSAFEACVSHAKLWLANSDELIHPQEVVTYAGLKEKLKKIMGSDYFTTRPELKAPDDVAAAVGHLQISEGNTISSENFNTEGDSASYENKVEQVNSQPRETYIDHQSSTQEEALITDEAETPNPSIDIPPVKQNLKEANVIDKVHSELSPRDNQYNPKRSNQNSRGGARGGNGAPGQTGRRGFSNGRTGGRGGGPGGYSNGGRGGGGGQYYESNYQPRGGYYSTNGGRGGGGGRFGGTSGGTTMNYTRVGNGGHGSPS